MNGIGTYLQFSYNMYVSHAQMILVVHNVNVMSDDNDIHYLINDVSTGELF